MQRRVTTLKRIAVLMERLVGFNHGVLNGIHAFATLDKGWLCHCINPKLELVPTLKQWDPDGVIAFIHTEELAHELHQLNKPMVDIANWTPSDSRMPRVSVDDESVGAMAAEYLLNLGFQEFGFFGSLSLRYSSDRFRGYARVLERFGYRVEVFEHYLEEFPKAAPTTVGISNPGLERWLDSLPKPIGIFADNDERALDITETCRSAQLLVPEQVAVIGVDDDPYLVNMGYPPISSISTPSSKIGFEAASTLDRLMRGVSTPMDPRLLAPLRVIERQSTNTLAIRDPDLAHAIHYIRTNALKPLRVDDVASQLPISRRTMETLFQVHLGRTPLDEIHRVRVETACRLLLESEAPLDVIAKRSGFGSVNRLHVVFGELMGVTPAEYRRRSFI